jgi:hypothetical protein
VYCKLSGFVFYNWIWRSICWSKEMKVSVRENPSIAWI